MPTTTWSIIFLFAILQVTIVDARKNDEIIVFGPIDGGKSAIIIGDQAKNTLLKGFFSSSYFRIVCVYNSFSDSNEKTFPIQFPQ